MTAREAVITWLWARRERTPLCLHGHPEALKALSWLGLDWEETVEVSELPGSLEEGSDGLYMNGVRVLDELEHPTPAAAWAELGRRLQPPRRIADPARQAEIEAVEKLGYAAPEVVWLASLQAGSTTLEELSSRGVLAEGVLSYLAESSWTGGRSLTRGQLLKLFDPAQLQLSREQAPVPFQLEELEKRHRHFLAELSPGELWERSLGFWPGWALPDELSDQQLDELEALALLYAAEIRYLSDFPRVVQFYFVDPPGVAVPEAARRALEGVREWQVASLSSALDNLPEADRLEPAVLGRPAAPARLSEVLAVLGREKVLARLSLVAPAG